MASGLNLKGLTIEIGGDVSNLQTALKDVNGEISNLQANLRTVESALKLDPTNVDALAQKQKLLTDAIDETAKKLEILKEAQRQADETIANGGEVDAQAYRNLESEIVRTQSSLHDYQSKLESVSDQLNNVGNETEATSESVEDLGSDFEETGEKGKTSIGGIADAMVAAGIAKIVQEAGEAVLELGNEFSEATSNIVKGTGATGEALRGMQTELYNAYNQLELPFDQVGSVLAEVNTRLGLTGDALTDVTVKIGTFADNTETDAVGAVDMVVDVMKKWGLTAQDLPHLLDILTVANQSCSLSVDQISKYLTDNKVQFDSLGYSVSESTALIVALADSGVNVGTVLTGMRKTISFLSEETNDVPGAFNAMIQAIANCGSVSEALQMQVGNTGKTVEDVFGTKAAQEMINAIQSGNFAIEDWIKVLGNADGALERTDAAADTLSDKWAVATHNIQSAFASVLAPAIEAISSKLAEFVQKIGEFLNKHPAIVTAITAIGTALTTLLVVGTITTLVQKFISVFATIGTILTNPIGLVIAGVAALGVGIAALVTKMSDGGFKAFENQVIENAKSVSAFNQAVASCHSTLIDASKLLSATGKSMSDLDAEISQTENAVTSILKTALSEQRQLREDELASIASYNKRLADLQREKLDTYRQQMTTELMKINAESSNITQEGAAQYVRNLQTALEQANQISEQSYSERLSEIYNFHQAQGSLDSAAYQQDIAKARSAYQQELSDSQAFYNKGIAALTENAREWVQVDTQKWNSVLSATGSSKKAYAAALSEINQDNANAFLSMYAEAKRSGAQISAETQNTARLMLAAFDGLPKGMQESGKEALLGIVSGMKNEMPTLENASEKTAQEIVDTLRSELDIHSPSKVTAQIGGYIVEGLAEGMNKKDTWIGQRIANFASGIVAKIRGAFQIGSPSKVMRDQVGQWIPEGIGEGISENADAAIKPVKGIISGMSKLVDFQNSIGYNTELLKQIDQMENLPSLNSIDSTHNDQINISRLFDRLDRIEETVQSIEAKSAHSIYLDGKKLVGEIAPRIDLELGEIAFRRALGAL